LVSPNVYTDHFFHLAYLNPNNHLYSKGTYDVLYVISSFLIITLLRAGLMEWVFEWAAMRAGIRSQGKKQRFIEQAWRCTYFLVMWTAEMVLLYQSPYRFDSKELWTDWPLRELTVHYKRHYLVQLAFWLQQLFTLHIEKRRSDHWQMFLHHVVTIALISASYYTHFTSVGHAVMCVMDPVDILLPLAKLLKYLHFQKACDFTFVVFVIFWIVARHGLFLAVLYSTWAEAGDIIGYRCFPFPRPALDASEFTHDICLSHALLDTFITLLAALQCMTVVWFAMIVKVAVRVLVGNGAEDSRSDDDDSDSDSEKKTS